MSSTNRDATTELAALRARLATAEAVIAALPRCDSCEDKATYSNVLDSGMLSRMCDKHALWGSWKVTYAEELRAYLALVEAQR